MLPSRMRPGEARSARNGGSAYSHVLRASFPLVSLVLILLAVSGIVLLVGTLSMRRVLLAMLVNLVAVVGLYVFSGLSGILSFGHVGFMALGAYVSALLTIPSMTKASLLPDVPTPLLFIRDVEMGLIPALAIAACLTFVFAVLVAVPLMRLSGIHAALATVAVLIIVQVVLREWDAVTRGRSTLVGVPRYTTVGVALAAAILVVAATFLYQRSSSGMRLRASRDDLHAAKSVGVRPLKERVIAFGISAAIVSVSGVLYAHMLGQLNPVLFYFHMTFVIVSMLIIGGLGSLAGAVIGVLAVTILTEVLRHIDANLPTQLPAGLTESVLALALLLIMVLRPSGITGGREIPWPMSTRRSDRTAHDDLEAEQPGSAE